MIKIEFDLMRVVHWLRTVFGDQALSDVEERALRFGEESLELIQSLGISQHQAEALVKQVYGNPPGNAHQELGGTMVTLASLCAVSGMTPEQAYLDELERCERPEIMEKIKRKHDTKAVVSSNYPSRWPSEWGPSTFDS